MSYRKTTEDLNILVGKLANLITDTFKCCIRNYEALLPYLEKKETNFKIHHKLVQVNILLNKLNEELVGLRVECITDSSYEQKEETVLPEGGRKRRTSDMLELASHETKSIKMEVPFFNNTKCYIALTSETGNNIKSDNWVQMETEETSNTQAQRLDMHEENKIETEIQDSNEVEDIGELSIISSQIPAVQKSCDTTNEGRTVRFAGDENVKNETSSQEKCEDSANVPSEDHNIYRGLPGERSFDGKESPVAFTTCDKQSAVLVERTANSCNKEERRAPLSPVKCVPIHRSENLCSIVDELYGVKNHKKNSFKCTLCKCVLSDQKSLYDHVNGKKHQKKLVTAIQGFAITSEVPNNSSENMASTFVCSAVTGPLSGTVPSNSCESIAFVPACSPDFPSPAETDPSDGCESTDTVSCSLADAVAVVEDKSQAMSMEHAIGLDNIWTYFHPPFHINKKFIRFYSGKIVCYLCYQEVEGCILSIRKHISRLSHLDRIDILRNIELESKSSNKQLLDIPGSLKNVVPSTQFSMRNNGFFCSVCNSFCENKTVLNHMTGESHGKKLDEMKKISIELTA